ncbi:MAG: glycerol-3-phosphate dehydrogenase/oxidase [Acidobacteria bacterium]|nr:glycerol-3-phosphate dehydrogenase/oxidase [Acidobacteriota bacterium]
MQRDPDALIGRTFDLLVVGGGIYGLTIAYDAAQRGLSVALVERADFGSGASFNHLRTIHGGLRYLQTLDVARARESVVERRVLATIAPHAVRPIPFALPLYRSMARGITVMRAGFILDRLLGFDRNRDVMPSHQLPAGRVVSGDALRRFPGLHRRGVTGAAVWYDYVTTEADRLTFSFAIAASQHGAVLANHLEAVALVVDGRRTVGVRARDAIGGRDLDIAARVTVNATGAAVDRLLEPAGASTRIPMLKVMNLVTERDADEAALGGRTAAGRSLFLVPWRGRAVFGTWQAASLCRPEDTGIVEADVVAFIREINEAFPSIDLRPNDVTMIHRGIVPAVTSNGRVSLEGHEHVHDHASEGTGGLEGLMSVVGTKYTTARGVAERVTDRVLTKLQRPAVPCRTATVVLPGGDIKDVAATVADARRDSGAGLPSETIPHLVAAYGSRYRQVVALCEGQPDLTSRLAESSPVIGAELVWAVRHEMAVTLADAVVRRTPLGALGYPGDMAVDRAADLIAGTLGWSHDRQRSEVAALRRFYSAIFALTSA